MIAAAGSSAVPAAAQGGRASTLEEVVVTAQRREESLQDTPISITAFTPDRIADLGIHNVTDIGEFAPNISIAKQPGSNVSLAIYIRGVGSAESSVVNDPKVGVYVDGVYVSKAVGGVFDVVDLERVEVLRGPQGTLFGRNTIGGAISVTTVKPEPGGEFGGYVSGATGTDDLLRLKGSVHLPLGETLAARLSVADLNQDGYVERTDGVDLGDDDTTTGRAALAWHPNERFAADLAFEATRDRENGQPMRLIGIDFTDLSQLQGLVASVPPPMAFIHNVTFGATAPGVPCAATDAAGNGVTYNPAAPNCYDARYIGKDGKNQGTAPAFSEADLRGASATLRYELTPALTLKSISAWRDLDAEFARDGDDSPHRISQFYDELGQEQYTQELQLLGSHERLNWILGLYYFTEEGENTNILDFTVSNFRSGGDFENESWAAFAQATYDITSTLHLTLGARQTEEEKSFRPDQVIFQNYFAGISQVVPPGNPLAALDAPFLQAGERVLPYLWKDIDTSEFTPMANLSWDAREDLMLYLGYSEGFKSGGFTQRVFPPIVAGYTAPPGTPDIDLIPTYDPEFVDVWELGFKWSGLDGQLRLNGAAFRTEYEDMQVQVFDSVAPVTRNIGKATIDGLELELQAAPGAGWLIDASATWLDPGYDEIDTANTLIGEDYEFERVPEYAASLGVSKEFDLESLGFVTVRGDWSYRDATYNDAYNTPLLQTDSYDLIDASVRWQDCQRLWTVALSGRNLGDEEYLVTGVYGTAFQSLEGTFDRGRQWQLELRRDF